MGFTTVYIFADLDRSQAGKTAAIALADRLLASGIKVFLIFPDQELIEDKKSVDFLDVYNCKKDLLKNYLAKTTLWSNESLSQKQFVEMRPEAFHGVAGKFVERVKPHTEADPNGILAQFLVLIGNIIGRGCCFKIGATSHHLNFFAVIVGDSSKSRKGDGLQMCLYLLKQLDPEWFKTRVIKGLSSGEGVIHAMRDAVFQEEAVTDKSGKIIELKNVEIDPGVKDKRLTAIEGEFVSALKTASRDGNILTAILREAWDGNPLQTLTKTNSERVLYPHFSLVGHITDFELKKYFSETDAMNGTGNRILWFKVRRYQLLPFGGMLDSENFDDIISTLHGVLNFARQQITIKMADDTKKMWPQIYARLTKESFGIFGSITARAEAQVVRLAMMYAVLDASTVISPAHLNAALAVWDYTEESCRQLFGGLSGYPTADKILTALRGQPSGMTRSQIGDLFGRHGKADEISKALLYLIKNSLVVEVEESTGGRPTGRWFAV